LEVNSNILDLENVAAPMLEIAPWGVDGFRMLNTVKEARLPATRKQFSKDTASTNLPEGMSLLVAKLTVAEALPPNPTSEATRIVGLGTVEKPTSVMTSPAISTAVVGVKDIIASVNAPEAWYSRVTETSRKVWGTDGFKIKFPKAVRGIRPPEPKDQKNSVVKQ
jgi:hypothetical protein